MRLVLLFFLLQCSFAGFSQQQMGSFMAYGQEAKFFSNLNFRVYQSKNGYLWIGTQNGLVRFDGKRYKNYFSDYANPSSPSDNSIVDIVEDKNGDLWFCGFFHGVTHYNQRTGLFRKYPRLSNDNYSYYGVYAGLKDSEGELWFCTAGRGLARYEYEKDSFSLFFPEPDKSIDGRVRGDNYVTNICEDRNDPGILWITSFKGLYSFDKRTKKFSFFPPVNAAGQLSGVLCISIVADQNGYLWIGTWGEGIYCFDPVTKTYITVNRQKIPAISNDIRQVNDSILYIAGMNEGLFSLNIKNNQLTNITPSGFGSNAATEKPDIQKVSITPDAGIFVGGNYFVYQQHPVFTRLKKNIGFAGIKKEEGDIAVNDVAWDEKRQQYWLATYNGGLYSLQKDGVLALPLATSPGISTGNSDFEMVALDALGRVWARNIQSDIYVWKSDGGAFVKAHDELPLPDSLLHSIRIIETDRSGNIWMVSPGHFIFWNVLTGEVAIIPIEWGSGYTGSRMIGYGELLFDPSGNAWLISGNGLFQCLQKEKKVIHIYKTGTLKTDLSSSEFLAGVFNKYDNLWLAGNQSGVQVYDWKSNKVLSNHNMNGGLPSMLVKSLQTDTSGRIWASTVAGLGMFDPEGKKIWQLFNRFDGLERDYLDHPIFITSNNKIIVDQLNGFVLKDINELLPPGNPPKMRITSITINNEERKDSLLPEFTTSLVLPYNKNNVSIEFAAMDWWYPFRTNYRYSVEGLSGFETNTAPDPSGKITLVGLQPGRYKVHIRALNSRGQWSDEVLLSIIIRPPFWKTIWFISLLAIIFIVLMYGVYRYRINQLKKLQAMRNSISRNLHDDIGASLSNIRILNELAKRNTHNSDRATGYLDTAAEDIQRISESLGDIVWNINPKYDEPEQLFIRMKRYAADIMDGKNIAGTFEFPEQDYGVKMTMDKRRDFYLIFKEAIHNLVKYSGTVTASVKVQVHKNGISLTIRDEGKGFDLSQVQQGSGLQNMQQRAAAWNGILDIDSKPGKGTTVYLFMPV
jgi:ligand-binding sensor domain-containing protein/two-component sensor histidine kinase